MAQQTFQVGRKPRVVISHGHGTVTIRSWQEQAISIDTTADSAHIYQEGDAVFIKAFENDLNIMIPYIKPWRPFPLTTDVNISDQSGAVSIEDAGNVELSNIDSDVLLSRVEGNLRANNIPSLREQKGIGGNAELTNVARIELGAIGANIMVRNAELVHMGAVGGSMDVESIGAELRCGAIGANCHIYNSPRADIQLNNVGGNLQIDDAGTVRMGNCNVGGNLTMPARFQESSNIRIIIGGNATITLPEHTNLAIQAMVGGQVMGEALGGRKGGSFFNAVYGNGSSSLTMTVGGNLRLHGNVMPNGRASSSNWGNMGKMEFAPFADFGREMGRMGRDLGRAGADMANSFLGPNTPFASPRPPRPNQSPNPNRGEATQTQKREAILRMVAEGRISPEEGNMLLDALDK